MSVSGSGMTPEGGYWEIDHGWDVFGADGEKVGDVADVQSNFITVSKGFIFKTDMYIPVSAISNVEHDRVYLNVTKDQVEAQGWDRMPETNETDWDRGVAGGMDTDTTTRTTDARRMRDTDRTLADRDRMTVPVVEEQLSVDKRETERGRVRVNKDVVEEERTVNVPLREEEVRVSRRPATGGTVGDVPEHAFEEQDIEIPIRGEEATVTKQPVVREEVDITKQTRERQQPVSGTVRREEVRVEGADGAVLNEERTAEVNRERRRRDMTPRGTDDLATDTTTDQLPPTT
jgi:uncharacterized protein (TIGR02271 family)